MPAARKKNGLFEWFYVLTFRCPTTLSHSVLDPHYSAVIDLTCKLYLLDVILYISFVNILNSNKLN